MALPDPAKIFGTFMNQTLDFVTKNWVLILIVSIGILVLSSIGMFGVLLGLTG